MSLPVPSLAEVVGRLDATLWRRYLGEDLPAHILRAECGASAGPAGLFRLYDEMEEKDGHLFAVLQTRKNGVLSCPRAVVAASDAPRDRAIARFVEHAVGRIPSFDRVLHQMLDALGKGVSVQEILWEIRGGRVEVRALRSRRPWLFGFAPDGAVRLEPFADPSGAGRPLPPRKFLRFTFGGLYEDPLGCGLCRRAYWYYFFKKNNLKQWILFNEKFGSPTVVGRYAVGADEEERERILEIVRSVHNDSGVVVPESVTLELLEARRAGNVSSYRELSEWCNDEISRIVLGATLTSGEGRRSGSYALARVHEQVRGEYVESDARALEDAVNSQLVRWLVDFNFGPEADAPRWTIDTTPPEELEKDLAVDKQLVALGVALPRAHFYARYRRPAPQAGEPALTFDDQNLFQYHLTQGVVTVNEARARLGLAPVPWGEGRCLPASGGNLAAPLPDLLPGAPEERPSAAERDARR